MIVNKSKVIRKENSIGGYDNRGWASQVGQKVNRHTQLWCERSSVTGSGNWTWNSTGVLDKIPDHRGLSGIAYAQAYDRLMSNAAGSKRASLGVSVASSQQSWAMVADRSMRLVRAASQARRGRLVDAAEILLKGSSARARRLRKRDHVSDSWLELQFGWLPLYDDIHSALNVLSSSIPTERVRGSGQTVIFDQTTSWQEPTETGYSSKMGTKRVMLSGDIRTVNPNLLLAKQLGVTNPAHVAWDLVPFSFVVDWFLPVSKFVQSWDSHYGIQFENTAGSYLLNAQADLSYTLWNGERRYNFSHLKEYRRQPSSFPLPGFGDRFNSNLDGSWWRAVTSVTLAMQQLRKLS